MDVTASVLTIVQSVFTLTVRLKNLSKETRAHVEDVDKLQDRAEKHALLIQAARNILREQVNSSNDSWMHTDKRYIERRLQEAALSFQKDFERFESELEDLLGEGTRHNVEFLVWGKSRVGPAIDKIKTTLADHERELGTLMHIHHGIVLHEVSKIMRTIKPSQPPDEPEEVDPREVPLRPAATFDSISTETTLVGRTSREPSFSAQASQTPAPLINGRLLLPTERKKSRDKGDMPALLLAICKGEEKLVKALLDQGADILARDRDKTVLHLAMNRPNREVLLRSLLSSNKINSNGLDLDASDDDMNSALHYCADRKKSSAAKILLKYGASPEVRDADGRTPLYCAISNDYGDVVEALLEGGATINKEYLSITKSEYMKKLLKSKMKGPPDEIPRRDSTQKNSRKMSFTLRRGSAVKV